MQIHCLILHRFRNNIFLQIPGNAARYPVVTRFPQVMNSLVDCLRKNQLTTHKTFAESGKGQVKGQPSWLFYRVSFITRDIRADSNKRVQHSHFNFGTNTWPFFKSGRLLPQPYGMILPGKQRCALRKAFSKNELVYLNSITKNAANVQFYVCQNITSPVKWEGFKPATWHDMTMELCS